MRRKIYREKKKRKRHKPLTSLNLSTDIFNLIFQKKKERKEGEQKQPESHLPPPNPQNTIRTEKNRTLQGDRLESHSAKRVRRSLVCRKTQHGDVAQPPFTPGGEAGGYPPLHLL